MPPKRLAPVHPGGILRDDFLEPLGISQRRLAKELHVPAGRIHEIVNGRRPVTADMALRLARFFGTSGRFWLSLQLAYDLDVAFDRVGGRIAREVSGYRNPTNPAASGLDRRRLLAGFLERRVRIQSPGAGRKPLSKRERERILGYGPDGV